MALLPDPPDLGLPAAFPTWRPGQDALALRLLDNPGRTRFSAVSAPVASGKSLAAVALALLTEGRTLILCSTKGQQDQYQAAFRALESLADIRGQNAYLCRLSEELGDPFPRAVDLGYCQAGDACQYRKAGCRYYDAVSLAADRAVAVTNYAYWITQQRIARESGEENALGSFDLLICDEADTLLGSLEQAHALDFTSTARLRLLEEVAPLPPPDSDLPDLASWATRALPGVKKALRDLSDRRAPAALRRARELRQLAGDLDALAGAGESDGWVVDYPELARGRRTALPIVQPVWPTAHAEDWLWAGIPRVVLLSGTLPHRLVDHFGLGTEGTDWDYLDLPSQIHPDRRRLTHVKTASMSRNRADYSLWAARLDQILGQRMDRKTLIQTVSYDRARRYLQLSEYRYAELLDCPDPGAAELQRAVGDHLTAPAPRVLVSPAISRGYDFAGEAARCNVIAKVPHVPTQSNLMAARRRDDPRWPQLLAVMEFEQMLGRGVRNEEDWCENLVIDDDFTWWWRQVRDLATQSLRSAVEPVRTVALVPEPPALFLPNPLIDRDVFPPII